MMHDRSVIREPRLAREGGGASDRTKCPTLPTLARAARGWRRYKNFFGLAAIAAFLFALPAAALACVSASTCTSGGGIVVVFGGAQVCSGGASAGATICAGGSGSGQNFTPFMRQTTPQDLTQDWTEDLKMKIWDWLRWQTGLGYDAPIGPNPFPPPPPPPPDNPPGPEDDLGGPVKFSMHSSEVGGPYVGADIFGVHNTGYRTSDSAGAIAPGSLAPGFNLSAGGGGFAWAYDASRALGSSGNDRLLFGVSFDYQRQNTNYGTSVLTPGLASAGSTRNDVYTLNGSVTYSANGFHASGMVSYDWAHNAITNNVDSGTGNTNGEGYGFGGSAGYILPLWNTTGVSTSAMPTKAPPSPRYGGYATFVDLSGHVLYRNDWDNGFTDSTGFVFGTERISYTDLGASANLVTVIPTASFVWMPYVGVSLDQQIGFSHTFDIPTAADTIFFNQSTTFWTLNAGLNVLNRSSIQAGIAGFYSASGDTNIYGGSVFLKIPFYPTPPGDSGIRTTRK